MPDKLRKLFNNPRFNFVMIFFLKRLALGMSGIFITIYLYTELNYSIESIVLLFLLYAISNYITGLGALKLINRIGVNVVLYTSIVLHILFFIVIQFVDQFPVAVPILIYSIWGSFMALRTYAYFIQVSSFPASKSVAKEVNIITQSITVADLLAPLLGGLIISFASKGFLATICVILVSLTVIFIRKIPNIRPKVEITYRSAMREWWFYTKRLGDSFCNIFNLYALFIFNLMFPFLLLFVSSDNSTIQGLMGSISIMAAIVFSMVISKIYDNQKTESSRKLVLRAGIYFYGIGLFLRGAVVTPLIFFIATDIFFRISQQAFGVPFNAQKVTNARTHDALRYKVTEEFSFFIGRTLAMLTVYFVAVTSQGNVQSFVSTGINIPAIVMILFGVVYSTKYAVIRYRSTNPRYKQLTLKRELMKKRRREALGQI